MTKPRRRQAGEGGISAYETKAGTRFWAKYKAPLEDGTTREVLKRGFASRKAAADFLRDVNSEIAKGVYVVPSKITVAEWLDQWLASLRLAPSTRSSYAKNVRLHVKPQFGQIQLARLTGTRISALYRDLERSRRQDHHSGTGLSARTVRYIHTILKAALREAVAHGLIAANPADKARPPAAREARAPEIRPWTAAELSTFLAWADERGCSDGSHGRSWRTPECAEVRRWRNLDVEEARLSVRRSVGLVRTKGESAQMLEGTTKSGRERVVDIDPQTIAALRSWRVARASLDLRLARDDALVFGDIEGKHQHPERFSRRFSEQLTRCRRQLGEDALPSIRLHDLRHTHASLMLKAGVPVKVVSERLGHSGPMITMTIYQHVMPGMQAEAAARSAELVGGAS